MNGPQVALVLDRLATAFRYTLTSEDLAVWTDHIGGLDAGLATEVVETLISNHDGFMPTVAAFRDAYAAAHRARMRERRDLAPEGPNPSCGWCGGTEWVEVDPHEKRDLETGAVIYRGTTTVRPCEACFPEGYEKFRADLPKRKAMLARFSPPETFDYNPMDALRAAAEAL